MMAPFEALYSKKCRTPLNQVEPEERRYYSIEFVKEAEEQVRIIQQHIEATLARQKSYADKRRRPLTIEVGDYVYLKVSPMKGVPQRVSINHQHTTKTYMIQHTCHTLHKVHKYSSSIRVRIQVITNQVQVKYQREQIKV